MERIPDVHQLRLLPFKRRPENPAQKKWKGRKKLLAMKVISDINDPCGESLGSISRDYECVGHSSVYPYFGRLFRPALRGYGLSFQRDSGKCSVYSQ